MTLRFNNQLVLAKTEAVAGTAVALAAADAVQCGGVEVTPIAGDAVDRPIVRPYFGARPTKRVRKHARIRLTVELSAAGTKGDAPAWGRFLTACWMTETLTAQTKAVYSCAVPAAPKSLTVSCNYDGYRHTLAGRRGTWSITVVSGGVPIWSGSYAAPADAALIANPDYSDWEEPIVASHAGTPTATLFGAACAVEEISLDYGADTDWRDRIGAAPATRLKDRASGGNFTVDLPAVASLAVVDKAATDATGALEIVHGSGDGNIVRLHAPEIQLGTPSIRDGDGVVQISSDYLALPSSGNDDLTIEVK